MIRIRSWSLGYSTVASMVVAIGLVKFALLTLLTHSAPVVPDELGYSEFVSFLALGGQPFDWIRGYGAYLVRGSGALIEPGVLLARLGVPGLDAIRLVSSAYSVASGLVLVILIRFTNSQMAGSKRLRVYSLSFVGLMLYLLMPSHALWGVLGLKDSASEFFLMSALVMAIFAFHATSWGKRSACLAALAVSVAGMFTARYYLSYLLALAIAAAYLVPRIVRGHIGWSVAATAIVGVTFGQLLLHPANTALNTTAMVGTINNIPVQREQMTVGADSAFAVGYCPQFLSVQERLVCEVQNLPSATLRVMFSPLTVTSDSGSGALVWLAVVENYVWIVIIVSSVLALVMTRSRFPRGTLSAALLCASIALVLGLVSGNAGTAFRHKSQLLVGISVIFALAGPVRRIPGSTTITTDVSA